MERLTKHHFKKQDGFYMTCSEHCSMEDFSCEDCGEFNKLVDRLGTIEDILGDDYDLDRLRVIMDQRITLREEVAERWKLTGDIPLDRLAEIVRAEKEGRCVVLPCKQGDTVWRICGPKGRKFVAERKVVSITMYEPGRFEIFTNCDDWLGETVFLTREEAEKALKEGGEQCRK